MADTISYPLLEQFSGFLARRIGLHFPPERWPDMVRRLERAAPDFGPGDVADCMRRLLTEPLDRAREEALASCLTIGETYFYREPAVFAALENDVLLPLIASRRAAGQLYLHIWSAGCCTGEEVYSVAVLLTRLVPDLGRWNITLLGTDINPDFLAKAAAGEYREWSFRGTPEWFRAGYFTALANGNYALVPRIRRMATFASQNLVDETAAFEVCGMDIVLCRNVLMYFEPEAVRVAMDRLRGALVDGGWLVIGVTDAAAVRPSALLAGFAPAAGANAMLYRKMAGAAAPSAKRAMAPKTHPRPKHARVAAAARAAPAFPVAPKKQRLAGPEPEEAYRRALACYAQGDYAAAAGLLGGTAAGDVPGLTLAANAFANLGRLDEASRWCEAAVAADKINPGLRFLLASILIELGHDQAAANALGQALYLDPDHALAHFALGNLYRRIGPPAYAARHLAWARELAAKCPQDQLLPDGDGLTAGRLLAIIDHTEGVP